MPEMGVHGYPEIQGPSTVVRHLSPGAAFGSSMSATTMAPEPR